MSAVDVATIASAGIAAVSMIGAGVGWILARREKKKAAQHERDALQAAHDAATAATQSADAQQRIVAIVEEQERRRVKERKSADLFPWKLRPIPGDDDCILHNTSKTALYAVRVAGQKIHRTPVTFEAIGPGGEEELSILRVMQLGDNVLVSWQLDESDDSERLEQPLKIPSKIR